MACIPIQFPNGDRALLTVPDDEGTVTIGRRKWRWDFHDFLGPSFFRVYAKGRGGHSGETFVNDPPQEVWRAFEAWFAARKARLATEQEEA